MPTAMEPKSVSESRTHTNHIVLPSDSNALGSAFGGQVMAWIDICAAITAQRHCRSQVVTASIDEVHFKAPIRVGMIACLESEVTASFRRSIELTTTVHSEDPQTGARKFCCSARLTFAAIDDDFRPTEVPPLVLETEAQRHCQAEAERRREQRLQNRRG